MNEKFIEVFNNLAVFEDYEKRPFPAKAYRKAVKSFSELPFEITDADQIKELPGVGEAIFKKVQQILAEEPIPRYEEYLKSPIIKLKDMAAVKGFGMNKAKQLFDSGITSLEDLKSKTKGLKIGDKIGSLTLTKAMKVGLDYEAHTDKTRMTVAQHDEVALPLIEKIKKFNGVLEVEAVGSRRRWDGSSDFTIGDVDIIISATANSNISKALGELLDEVVMTGDTKVSGIRSARQIDFRIVSPDQYGALLLHATGPTNWNVECRKAAIKKGMVLNEYGLFEKETSKLVESKSERNILFQLGIPWVEPKARKTFFDKVFKNQ